MAINNSAGEPRLSEQLRARPGLRKTLLWALVLATVLTAMLIALPVVTAHYAEQWLKENGAVSASIEDVDINLFTGVVRVFGLQASGGARERLQIGLAELGIRWWPLTSQRIYVEFLRLNNGQIDVAAAEAGAWQIGGVTIHPTNATTSEPAAVAVSSSEDLWGFGSEVIALTDLQLTYRDTLFDTAIDVREFKVGSQFTWEAGRTTELLVDLIVDGSPLLLRSDMQPWAEQRHFSGAFKLSDLKLSDYQQVLQEVAGLGDPRGTINFDLQLDVTYDADGTLELTVSGPLEVRSASFALEDAAITNNVLRWEGKVGLTLPAPDTGPLLRIDGGLQLAGTDVTLAKLELTPKLGTLDWQGMVEFSPARTADTSAKFLMQATLAGTAFTLHHARLPYLVTGGEAFDLTSLRLDGADQFTVQQAQLRGLRVLAHQDGHPDSGAQSVADVLTLAQLEMTDLGFDAQRGLTIQNVMLRSPVVVLVRNEQGDFEDIDATIAAFASPDAATAPSTATESVATNPTPPTDVPIEPATPLKISIANLNIQGDDLLRFEDRAATPTTHFKLTKTGIELKNIDNTGDQKMAIKLVTGDGNMNLKTDGTVNPFADNQTAELTIQLAALDLTQISAYVPGYNIERGRLNADSNVVINGNTLEVNNALLIERLKLSGKAAEGNEPLAQGMAMPIDVALDLLRDGDDRIKLQLPVTGSLDDPKFGLGDIVRQATQKALQNAAMSYVKNALQPLGTLLLVRDLAAKAARPRFEPVAMAPGDASLSADGRDYLRKLGVLLTDRPGLRLTICGVATAADKTTLADRATANMALENVPLDTATDRDASLSTASTSTTPAPIAQVSDAQLLELAALRTASVIDFLVSDQGLAKERLFTCRETIEPSGEAPPRAEISL